MPASTDVYVGIGSNLDDPVAQVRSALIELGRIRATSLVSHSRLYRNPPMGPPDQPDYVNAVAHMRTGLDANELLRALQTIEDAHGRARSGERWGPRTLDLDLLLYGDALIDTPDLTVPHPGLARRAFVLVPLAEIAPQLDLPGLGPLAALAARCARETLQAIDAP